MTECTAEDGLKLLSIAGISLPREELGTFKSEYNRIYSSSEKGYDFIETVWKVYSEILPVKAHPDDLGSSDIRRLVRDQTFQSKIIDSGISKKLKEGTSLSDLVKKLNSFS